MRNRVAVNSDIPLAVFIIGVKVNKIWAVHKWLKSVLAMKPMVDELYKNKEELGFYHTEYYLSWRGVTLVQYWKSNEAIMDYSKGKKHTEAYKLFYKTAAASNSLGIFHEAYSIEPNHYHSLYVNMPEAGLLKALEKST
ncbi:hypothetical protein J2S05_002523 [Alkalicoccobacillus murimartini]|uniref:DUF4188 domain-containing protein n=1 Tax=Alkalicoccobacillus murimartini TaxID=171685 RepID=A0ABT9YIR9_9BACI|nr:hypothetical protein [Alkalicoccobacillus murimartini]